MSVPKTKEIVKRYKSLCKVWLLIVVSPAIALGIYVRSQCSGTCQINWPVVILVGIEVIILAFCISINNKVTSD